MDNSREVVWTYHKSANLQVRVSRILVGDEKFFDIREYIPSKDFYGRGLTLPSGVVPDLGVVCAMF